jgi:branched-chain amino acid transport system substrate-binding protein
MLRSCAGLVALTTLLLSSAAMAQEKIKVGVTATLEGTYTVLGEDGIRGHQTAINALGKKVGDKEIEFIVASTDATPDSAVRAVRKLIERLGRAGNHLRRSGAELLSLQHGRRAMAGWIRQVCL